MGKTVSNSLGLIIPTFRSGEKIVVSLEAIFAANYTPKCLTIVNNSPDTPIHEKAIEILSKLRLIKDIDVKIIDEPKTGLTNARRRGVFETQADIVVFIDDDNAISADYLNEGLLLMEDAEIGMLASMVIPYYYEGKPSVAVLKRDYLLGNNYFLGDKKIDFGAIATMAPTNGAGMWIRRELLIEIFDNNEVLLPDRTGDQLTSGGDGEIGFMVGKRGYRRVYHPGLKITHWIPASRASYNYFLRLISGCIYSDFAQRRRYGIFGFKFRINQFAKAIFNLILSPICFLATGDKWELGFRLQAAKSILRNLLIK